MGLAGPTWFARAYAEQSLTGTRNGAGKERDHERQDLGHGRPAGRRCAERFLSGRQAGGAAGRRGGGARQPSRRALPARELTQDRHPSGHKSFASANPGRQPFETVAFAYGPQVLWPDHCVQGTPGAQFHGRLQLPHAELVLRKGYRQDIDSYSAFYENDHTTPTGLAGYLRERGLKRVFVAGLALDFCVRYSAEDAHRCGFEVVVVEDACRGIDMAGSMDAAHQAFSHLAIPRVAANSIG